MGLHLLPTKTRHVRWQYIFLRHWSFCIVVAPFPLSIHHPYTYYYTKIWRQMPLSVKWTYTWLCLMHATDSLIKMVQRLNWSIRRPVVGCGVSFLHFGNVHVHLTFNASCAGWAAKKNVVAACLLCNVIHFSNPHFLWQREGETVEFSFFTIWPTRAIAFNEFEGRLLKVIVGTRQHSQEDDNYYYYYALPCIVQCMWVSFGVYPCQLIFRNVMW